MITIRFSPRVILPFGVAYGFMWALSAILLVPHYLSATFDPTRYMSIPFMTQVSAELSEFPMANDDKSTVNESIEITSQKS